MFIPKRKEVQKPKKSRKNKNASKTGMGYISDGLKYMNYRDNLIDLLEEKKMRESRLAYKVTECYPPKANLRESQTNDNFSDYERPAGITYEKG